MADKTIVVPEVGGSAEVIEVLIKPGDVILVDSPLITLESEKATMEVPSTVAGSVKTLKVKVGDKVSGGEVILILETKSDEDGAVKAKPAASKTAEISEQAPDEQAASTQAVSPPPAEVTSLMAPSHALAQVQPEEALPVHAGPAVRKLAREWGVDLARVSPSGPKSRILKEDVQGFVKKYLLQPPAGNTQTMGLPSAPVVDFAQLGPVQTIPLSKIQKLSGKNLHRNWLLAPHVTQFGVADITDLEAFRVAQKGELEKKGMKLTLLSFILKAISATLKVFPRFNASLDSTHEQLILKNYFHIGVAVDTPDGLVVPVIREVDRKSIKEIAAELHRLSEKARLKQLAPLDLQGGCFSISNLGGIGGTAFTPIINLPEVAILGLSQSSYQPVFREGNFVPRLMLPLSLSYDHRVIDGADGARFMAHLAKVLADVRHLLM